MKLHPLAGALVLCFGVVLAPPLSVAEGLPNLGEAAQTEFSPAMERRIGESVMLEIRRDPAWLDDRWTDPSLTRSALGDVGPKWSMDTPLRRDQGRWQALVEIDALAALMLGLTADQLCAMYRTQFAVLRKYEYKMVFDAEGRKICGYHQSAGYRQSQLQDQAKSGDLPKEWKNIWNLCEEYATDPESVDWEGHFTPPFAPANRETAMLAAHSGLSARASWK